jgi:chemotaxis signal transduction protein
MSVQLVACTIAGAEYAFPITAVREIIRDVRTQQIGSEDPTALGVIDLRGQVMPVHDLARALGVDFVPTGADVERGARRIVVTTLGDAEGVIGWLVDGVDEVFVVEDGDITDVDRVTSAVVRRIAHVEDGRLIPVLDIDQLLRGHRVARAA